CNVEYYLGVDGISIALILLTTALSFLAVLASWNIDRYVKGYLMLFLLLETGMVGCFVALDFFLFYIFWEVMLLPMYFLIGIWGGPRREYAAIKFFLYTLLGSVFILIALLGFYFTDVRDFVDVQQVENLAAKRASEGGALKKNQSWKDLTPQEQEKYRQKVTVNTFDLLTLTKAGKAAMLWLTPERQQDALKGVPGMIAAESERDAAVREARVAAVRARLADQPFL